MVENVSELFAPKLAVHRLATLPKFSSGNSIQMAIEEAKKLVLNFGAFWVSKEVDLRLNSPLFK